MAFLFAVDLVTGGGKSGGGSRGGKVWVARGWWEGGVDLVGIAVVDEEFPVGNNWGCDLE